MGFSIEGCTSRVSLAARDPRTVCGMASMRSRNGVGLAAVIVTLVAAACSGEPGRASPDGVGRSPGPGSADVPPPARTRPGVPVRLTFGSTVLHGRLNDTSTARALADQLPLTLT